MRFVLICILSLAAKIPCHSFEPEKKTLLVTGIAGFIGFHTALQGIEKGYSVFGIDNFNDYYDPGLKEARCKILEKNGIEVIVGDICDLPRMESIFNRKKIDAIIHLAGQAGVRASKNFPRMYLDSNIVGTWILLELNKEKKIPFIFASSSSVYGGQGPFPSSETHSTDEPQSFYAATKKTCETIAYSYSSMHQVPITCLRFFSVYGPWGRPDMAYYLFAKKILQREPIVLYDGGNSVRDLTYIDDIVAGIFLSLEKIGGFHIYNLGASQPHAVLEIVSELEDSLGMKAIPVFAAAQELDAAKTHADISKAQKELNYHPRVSLREGIGKFIDWLENYESELFEHAH